jgi:hypothetical protein
MHRLNFLQALFASSAAITRPSRTTLVPRMMQGKLAFAGLLMVSVFLSTPSWGWFWERTNTVKSYEACLENNRSQVLNFFDLSERCIEKLAGPVPVDQIEVKYKQQFETVGNGEYKPSNSYVVSLSSKNFLLTGAVAKVQIGSGNEIEVVAKPQLPKPEQTVEAMFPVPDAYRYYVRCNLNERADCINLRLLSAKGFQITID